jgi:RNA polymerase sigma factor (sigma-70 family)
LASDAELLAAWQKGDRTAGGELIDRYFEPVRRFFLNKVGEGTDDLIQQTFLACVQQRDQIRTPEAFRGYLFAAARSKLIDWLRVRCGGPRFDGEVDSVTSAGVSMSSELVAREDERLLVVALRHLPVELQIALELYYFERVRGRELEIALALPAGTVRSRLRRGLEMLRKKVDELAATPELRRVTVTSLQRWAERLDADHD